MDWEAKMLEMENVVWVDFEIIRYEDSVGLVDRPNEAYIKFVPFNPYTGPFKEIGYSQYDGSLEQMLEKLQNAIEQVQGSARLVLSNQGKAKLTDEQIAAVQAILVSENEMPLGMEERL